MTSDVKLLPLPPHLAEYGETTRTMWLAYARACVEASTEALMAEVAELRKAEAAWDAAKDWLATRATEAEAQAERLAEALQIAHRLLDMGSMRVSHCNDEKAIRAALQEAGHD